MHEPHANPALPASRIPSWREAPLTPPEHAPPLAPVAVELMQLAAETRATVAEAAEIIRDEAAFAARVLGVLEALTPDTDHAALEPAMRALGLKRVANTALALKAIECFAAHQPAHDAALDPVEHWRHALAVACAARGLARARGGGATDPEDAFAAGLLHDVGKLTLQCVYPRGYRRVVAETEHRRGDIADCERAVLDTDHMIAGRRTLEAWRLPQFLQEAAWLHCLAIDSLPASVEQAELIGLVNLADVLARELRIGYSGNHVRHVRSEQVGRLLGFGPADLDEVSSTLAAEVDALAAALELERIVEDAQRGAANAAQAGAQLDRLSRDLAVSHRNLSAAAEELEAVRGFAAALRPGAGVAETVHAAAIAGKRLPGFDDLAVFGVHEHGGRLEVCLVEGAAPPRPVTLQASEELAAWLSVPHPSAGAAEPAPLTLREALVAIASDLASREMRLFPLRREATLLGVVVVFERVSSGRTGPARPPLAPAIFLETVAAALAQSRAHAAVQRVCDDLANASRRMQLTQSELIRSGVLSAVAEMAAGAGHELNTPLAVISGRAQLLRKQVTDPHMRAALELIDMKAHECSRIVSELMDFARPPAPNPADIDLLALLDEVRTDWLAESKLPASRVVFEPAPLAPDGGAADEGASAGTPRVRVDPQQFKESLRELLTNAAEATAANNGVTAIA